MTVLVTGAGGFVGKRIMYACEGAVPCPSLRNADQRQICEIIDEVKPDVIVNTAAISDIGVCEKNPDASYEANVRLPVMLARAANGARLIHFSSDQVYSGCEGDGPYREGDEKPSNTYAEHKLTAEKAVLELLPDSVMLRATWMYDMPLWGCANRGNFLVNTLKAVMAGREICCSSGQKRGLTYVREGAESITRLALVPGGIYNYGSENTLSMYDTAKALLDALDAGGELLRDAPARHNLQMDCSKLAAHGISFSSTAEGLLKCVTDYALHI